MSSFRSRYLEYMAESSTPKVYATNNPKHNQKDWNKKNKYLRKIGLNIGENVAIDAGFEFINPNLIEIGEWCVIGKNCKIYNYNSIKIGSFCMFAGEVQITNGSHRISDFEPYSGELAIGSGCWFGLGSKIVGTSIYVGENSVIGAGALVIDNVEPNSIMAGIPARKIGERTPSQKVWHLGNNYFSPVHFGILE